MSTRHEFFNNTHVRREYPVTCGVMRKCLNTGLSPVPRWTGLNLARNHCPLVSLSSCLRIGVQHALPVSMTVSLCPNPRRARSLRSARRPHSPDLGTRWWVPREISLLSCTTVPYLQPQAQFTTVLVLASIFQSQYNQHPEGYLAWDLLHCHSGWICISRNNTR